MCLLERYLSCILSHRSYVGFFSVHGDEVAMYDFVYGSAFVEACASVVEGRCSWVSVCAEYDCEDFLRALGSAVCAERVERGTFFQFGWSSVTILFPVHGRLRRRALSVFRSCIRVLDLVELVRDAVGDCILSGDSLLLFCASETMCSRRVYPGRVPLCVEYDDEGRARLVCVLPRGASADGFSMVSSGSDGVFRLEPGVGGIFIVKRCRGVGCTAISSAVPLERGAFFCPSCICD